MNLKQVFTKSVSYLLMGIGLVMMLLPRLVGGFVLTALSFIIGAAALGMLLSFLRTHSRRTLSLSLILFALAAGIFLFPGMLLTILGVGLIVTSVWSLIFSPQQTSLLTATLLILVGTFAAVNAGAAANTIIMIVGVVVFSVGLTVLLVERSVPGASHRRPIDPAAFFVRNRAEDAGSIRIRPDDEAEEVNFQEVPQDDRSSDS